jgi:hypothetical protein
MGRHVQAIAVGWLSLSIGLKHHERARPHSIKSLNPNGIVPNGPDLGDLGL